MPDRFKEAVEALARHRHGDLGGYTPEVREDILAECASDLEAAAPALRKQGAEEADEEFAEVLSKIRAAAFANRGTAAGSAYADAGEWLRRVIAQRKDDA